MRILVTGAAGFVGSHLAWALKEKGHQVDSLDSFDEYYPARLKRANARLLERAGIWVRQMDLAMDPLEGVLEDIELVIHAAAQPGNDAQTSYYSYIKNNLHATVSLLEAIKGMRARPRLIFCSTSSVYGLNATGDEKTLPAPVSPYGVTKLAAEAAVQSAMRRDEVQASILRYFSVYGPRERPDKLFPRLFYALKHGTALPLHQGSQAHQRSFTYVGDIVAGTLLAIEKWEAAQGEIFNLGSDELSTTGQALDLAKLITGQPLKTQELPPRPGDQLATHANIDKARDRLGYRPAHSLEAGLRATWAWAREAL